MVYIDTLKKWREKIIHDNNIQVYCYFYVKQDSVLKTLSPDLGNEEDSLAAKGYLGLNIESSEISALLKSKPYKGIHFSNNIFRLLGIYLASPTDFEELIDQKWQTSNYKYKYIISKVIPSRSETFWSLIKKAPSSERDTYLHILKFISGVEGYRLTLKENIGEFLCINNLDVIDLLLLEDLFKYRIDIETRIQYMHYDAKELVLSVLGNFNNSVTKLTNRRKGHAPFLINDEYDVQDLLYFSLKSIFPKLKYEEPTPQLGGTSNKIEFVLAEEGILIEVKMIKSSETEKKYIKEIKEDLESYHRYKGLKDIIFFIYDPYMRTKDRYNFEDLNGNRVKQDNSFNVTVILSP